MSVDETGVKPDAGGPAPALERLYKRAAPVRSMLEVEYDAADKPLTSFPEQLVCYLVTRFALKGRVLDIMCGRGEHAKAFNKLGLDVWAVDMAAGAAEELADRESRLRMCDMNVDPIPFSDDHFDVVFCKSAIEHVNADHLMAEIRRVLKPGGKVIVLTGDWYYMYRYHYMDHTHGYGCPWMKHSLRLILNAYGFRGVVSENLLYLPFTWGDGWSARLGRLACFCIRTLLPYPYTDNFTNPVWKVVRFSNEVQLLGYGVK